MALRHRVTFHFPENEKLLDAALPTQRNPRGQTRTGVRAFNIRARPLRAEPHRNAPPGSSRGAASGILRLSLIPERGASRRSAAGSPTHTPWVHRRSPLGGLPRDSATLWHCHSCERSELTETMPPKGGEPRSGSEVLRTRAPPKRFARFRRAKLHPRGRWLREAQLMPLYPRASEASARAARAASDPARADLPPPAHGHLLRSSKSSVRGSARTPRSHFSGCVRARACRRALINTTQPPEGGCPLTHRGRP